MVCSALIRMNRVVNLVSEDYVIDVIFSLGVIERDQLLFLSDTYRPRNTYLSS
jgi:hypothetical protein